MVVTREKREGELGLTLMCELKGLWVWRIGKEIGKEKPVIPGLWDQEFEKLGEERWMGYGRNTSMKLIS